MAEQEIRNQKNFNPREELSGWHLHPKAAGILLVLMLLNLCVVAWVPKDWGALRTLSLYLCAFSSGMLVAQRAAIWQRSDR